MGRAELSDDGRDLEARLRDTFDGTLLPEYMLEGVIRFVLYGLRPGDFLCAMLQNDVRIALHHADGRNRSALATWLYWFERALPGQCWGTLARFETWAAAGGIEGRIEQHDPDLEDPSVDGRGPS